MKFAENGERIFNTYELLEMLLYHVVSYKDTNPIAKMLILKFGDIEGVLSASQEELMSVPGVGRGVAEFLWNVGRLTDGNYIDTNEICETWDDYDKLGDMIVDFFDKREFETDCVAVFLFDNSMQLIGAKRLYELDYSSGAVRADSFLEYAISNRASVVASAHIHQNGPLFPTIGDKATNDLVSAALSNAGVVHLEHYVVSGGKYLGIMTHLSRAFVQRPALGRFVESKERARYV